MNPTIDYAILSAKKHYPFITYLLQKMFGKKLKLKKNQAELIDSKLFRKYRKYMIFYLKNIMSLIEPKIRKPRIRLEISKGYKFVNDTVQANKLNTVCEEARCPNIYECWDTKNCHNYDPWEIFVLGHVDFVQLRLVSQNGMIH